MPYSIEQKDDRFVVYNNESGKKVGEHSLRRNAVKQIKALNAGEAKEKVEEEPKEEE